MNLTDKVKELAKTTPFTEGSIAASLESRAKRGLPLDLQFFADNPDGGQLGDNSDDNPDNNDPDDKDNKDNKDNKDAFTRSEVDSEISKAVDKALKNRDAKHQEDLQKAIDDALAEKERVSKLSEKERKEEELTQKEKKLLERETEIARKELLSDARADLTDKGLPTSFAELLLGEDAEKTLENINNFKTAFDNAVNESVKEKLRQDTPLLGGGGAKGATNFGKQLAQMNKKSSENTQKAQYNYFKDGGNQ